MSTLPPQRRPGYMLVESGRGDPASWSDNMKRLSLAIFSLVLIGVAALVPAGAAFGRTLTISGEVTYRERIALPAGARLSVRLIDVTGEQARQVVEAVAPVASRGQIPLQFVLSFEDRLIRAGRSYALTAEIATAQGLWFRNPLPQPVDPLAQQPQLLIVEFVGQIVGSEPAGEEGAAPSGKLQVSAALTDTIWISDRIDGRPALARTTLSIAADRRAGGSAACNNYFAEANFDGPALTFGEIVATRRLCAPAVMEEERRFFASLAVVQGYRLEGSQLFLLDREGTSVLRFRLGRN